MSKTVGDFFVERLYEWGVRTIFGYPGDGINGVLGALDRAKHRIEFIQVRHDASGRTRDGSSVSSTTAT